MQPNCPYIDIVGDGSSLVNISSTASTLLSLHDTSSNFDFYKGNRVSGLHITDTNSAPAVIQAGDVIWARFDDLRLDGPGSGGAGFVFQSNNHWMERATISHVSLAGFANNLHFKAPNGGTESFGYWLVDGLWTNQVAGTCGVVIDSGTQVYHTLGWSENLNSQGTSTSDYAFCIGGDFDGENFSFVGENANAAIGFAHLLAGGEMVFSGDYQTFGGEGAVRDANAGPFFIGPYAGDGVYASTYVSGTISNFANTGNTVNVLPVQTLGGLGGEFPGLTAQMGYVISQNSTTSPSSPFLVFDPGIPFCLATLAGSSKGQTIDQAQPRDCFDGTGDLATFGGNIFAGDHMSVTSGYGGSGSYSAEGMMVSTDTRSGQVLNLTSPYVFGVHGLMTATGYSPWLFGINGPSAANNVGNFIFTTDQTLNAAPELSLTTAGISTPSLTTTGTAPSVGSGQVGLGGATAAASNCNNAGTLTHVAGCLTINVAGTTRYVPYF